ncbi:unnamed protein product, partial [Symbiodinium pilosum]
SPTGNGWYPAPSIQEEIPAVLSCQRKQKVITEKFGPYHTGPAGNFVDLGEFQTNA